MVTMTGNNKLVLSLTTVSSHLLARARETRTIKVVIQILFCSTQLSLVAYACFFKKKKFLTYH